jgi:exportin-2 (importin alpha re-exporter)
MPLQQGVTATNQNVNIVQWFADNIFGDLQAGTDGVHPVLQVDAIRYLYTFRYQVCFKACVIMTIYDKLFPDLFSQQLTKEQLVSVLPLLLNRLDSDDVVVYTYAAVALDRILSMRVGDSTVLMYVPLVIADLLFSFSYRIYRFSSVDVQPFALRLLNVLLIKIEKQQSPERAAENDFLMRCAPIISCLKGYRS